MTPDAWGGSSHLTAIGYAPVMTKEPKAPTSYRVINLVPRSNQASKPVELIHITGHEQLSLIARRSITVLWHNAHRQGVEEGKRYTIPLADLMPTKHKGYERVEEVIISLMKTLLTIKLADGSTDRIQFLGYTNIADKRRQAGLLTYKFDAVLVDILRDSTIWGKISMPELMALSSKYSVPLYEHVSQWTGLGRKSHQIMSLEEFRALVGVEDSKYDLLGDLNRKVLKPIAAEINALAPFAIHITQIKTGKKVTHLRIDWWAKEPEQIKESWAEMDRSSIGRYARMTDQTEAIVDDSDDQDPA